MILKTGSVITPKNDNHFGYSEFVVDSFDVCDGFTRVLNKDRLWLADFEIDKHFELKAIKD